MKCTDNCIEINALPKCLTDDGQLILTNLTFPDSPSQDIIAMLHNVSSNASLSFTITTDADGNIIESDGVESVGLDLTEAYDLMNHVYKIEFLDKLTLQPVTVSICGEEACCLTFTVLPLSSSGEVPATTGGCGEPCTPVAPPSNCQLVTVPFGREVIFTINDNPANIDLSFVGAQQDLTDFYAPIVVTLTTTDAYYIEVQTSDTQTFVSDDFSQYTSVPC